MMKKRFSGIAVFIFIFVLIFSVSSISSYAEDDVLSAPESIVIKNTTTGAKLSWSGVSNATGYKIYRTATENTPKLIGTAAKLTFTDKTAQSGVLYNYSITAYNALGESVASENISHTYLCVPKLTKAENSYGGIELKWTKTPGAESYTIYRKRGANAVVLNDVSGTNSCTYLDKSAAPGKRYNYYVVANSKEYKSAFIYKLSTVYVDAPSMKKAVNRNGYVEVSWKKVTDASYYRIFRQLGNGSWNVLKTVRANVTSFKDKNVTSGTEYSYKVIALKGSGKSAYSKTAVTAAYLSVPQNITVSNTSFNGCYIKWSKVKSAKSYEVYRKDSKNTSWKKLGTVSTNSYKDTTAKHGRNYIYTVRATGKLSYKSYFLSGTKATCIHKPANVNFTLTSSGIKLSWSKISVGNGYKIYRKSTSSSDYKHIKTITSNATNYYLDKNVANGKSYIYTVRAIKGSTNGSYDKDGYKVTFASPSSIALKHSPKGIVISWSKSAVGTGYEIQRKADSIGSYKTCAVIKNRNTTSYVDSAPVFGKYNYYRIKVIYDSTLISEAKKIFGIDPNKKMVALTYDDGPNTNSTNSILDTLKKYNSRATFFVVGSRVDTYKDCIIRADSQGCEIGNHSYNHTNLTSVGSEKIKNEINSTNEAVKKLIGKAPVIVRTPGGSVNSTVKAAVGYPIISWNVDTVDWRSRSSSAVISKVKSGVRDGSIVLMHDLYSSTANATKEIVPWLINNGYQLVTVSEMMAVRGIEMKPGTVYYCG